jgi:hypothetical protein
MARLNAHRKLGGDSFTNSMLSFSSPLLTEAQRTMDRHIIQGISPDNKENIDITLKAAETHMRNAGFTDAEIAESKGRTVKGVTDALASGKLTKPQADAASYWLFSGAAQNKDFYSKAGGAQDQLFKQMVQPGITENIFSKGNETVKKNYTEFVKMAVYNRLGPLGSENAQVTGLPQVARLARTDSTWGVQYNPETSTFEAAQVPEKVQLQQQRTDPNERRNLIQDDYNYSVTARRVAKDLNTTMRHYVPVAEKIGEPADNVVKNVMGQNGLILGPDNILRMPPVQGKPTPVNTAPEAPQPPMPTTINKNSAISPATPPPPASVKTDKETQGDQVRVPDFAPNWNPTVTLTEDDKRVNPTQERLRAMPQPFTVEELRKAQEDQRAGRPMDPRIRDYLKSLPRPRKE